jgi:uncharacterized protein YbjT (DUF2867 family)
MILLTGATGLAGSFIANEFVRRREPVRLLVRNRTKAAELEKLPTIEIAEGDMSRRSSLRAALDGVERVLMISGPLMNMVETQSTFIDACKAAGVRHVIKFSGLDARHDTTFPFGLMHKQIEEHLENSGLAWTHLRPSGFMQVYLREATSIIKDGAFYSALGGVRLNPVDLADVGKAGYLLLRNGGYEGRRLPMTGPEALTMAEIAERISQAIGRTVMHLAISPAERRQALITQGIPAEFADALDKQVHERLKGGVESVARHLRKMLSATDEFHPPRQSYT